MSDPISLKLECGIDEYMCLQRAGTKNINAIWVAFNDTVYIEFEYDLQLQIMKTVLFRYVKNPMLFPFQNRFLHLGPLKLIKAMLKSFHVLLGLSPVWNRYPKGLYRGYQAFNNCIS